MKNLIISVLANILLIILPLAFQPFLIYNFKIIIIIIGSISIWLTQPIFSLEETQKNKSTDKFSVILIILMSYISLLCPIIIWVLNNNDKYSFTFLTILGIILLTIGILLRAWAVRKLGVYFTPTVQIQFKHQLITSGPYKLVRHPSYTGAFLAITSFALILNTLTGYIISIIAMSISYKFRIGIEEKELKTYFGIEYIKYSQHTKKLIPFLW